MQLQVTWDKETYQIIKVYLTVAAKTLQSLDGTGTGDVVLISLSEEQMLFVLQNMTPVDPPTLEHFTAHSVSERAAAAADISTPSTTVDATL